MSATHAQHAPQPSPELQVRAIEYLAEVLATSEDEGRGDDFYGRLSEATTSLTSLRRAVIFRYVNAQKAGLRYDHWVFTPAGHVTEGNNDEYTPAAELSAKTPSIATPTT